MVLTFGSFATEIHEPCQVRNEAALSESFCVPEGCLDRANCIGNVCGPLFEAERAVFFVAEEIPLEHIAQRMTGREVESGPVHFNLQNLCIGGC